MRGSSMTWKPIGTGWKELLTIGVALLAIACALPSQAEEISAEDAEFFEKNIRPLLVTQCLECHSDSIQAKGGFRLDVALGPHIGGQRGPSITGKSPEESLLISALKYENRPKMPPGGKLDDETIALFEEWIRRGAPDTRVGAKEAPFDPREIDWKGEGAHWAYQPLQAVSVPEVKAEDWAKTDIDRFVLSKLEEKELTPTADATLATWLRRVTLDLAGLPPTPGELLDFELDHSQAAKERIVDRLLSSPRFGERWGRHWLDVSRYGESTGKERNFVYLQAWRYRDYVIDSFNEDKPFNQFVKEQIAGDLLPHKDDVEKDRLTIATGFLALNPKGINDRNRESFLLEIVDEQIESVSRGLMAVTVTCARCHDHKYDPVSQADYYALGGIFRSTEAKFGMLNRTRAISDTDLLLSLSSEHYTHGKTIPVELTQQLESLEKQIEVKGAEMRTLADLPSVPATPAAPIQSEVPAPAAGSPEAVAAAAAPETTANEPVVTANVPAAVAETATPATPAEPPATASTTPAAPAGKVGTANPGADVGERPSREPVTEQEKLVAKIRDEIRELTKQADAIRAQIVEIGVSTMAIGVTDRPVASDIPIRIRGEVDRLGDVVPRGFLTVLKKEGQTQPVIDTTRSGRLELADWITSPENPLTPRVYVNRVWSKLLGRGIVSTVDDFGVQGESPTHPELLDFLAKNFIERGWSTKKLVREIVLSRVYGISEDLSDKVAEVDPENKLLSKWNRRRIDAEVIRDAVLSIAGTLEYERPFGTPLLELGVRELGVNADYSVVHKPYPYRSVYLPYLRGRAPEILAVFDSANPSLTVGKRDVTSGPDQALYLLNSPFALDASRNFAKRLLQVQVPGDEERIELAFRLALGVLPTQEQKAQALAFLGEFESVHRNEHSGDPHPPTASDIQLAVWSNFSQTLFTLPQFRYVF